MLLVSLIISNKECFVQAHILHSGLMKKHLFVSSVNPKHRRIREKNAGFPKINRIICYSVVFRFPGVEFNEVSGFLLSLTNTNDLFCNGVFFVG